MRLYLDFFHSKLVVVLFLKDESVQKVYSPYYFLEKAEIVTITILDYLGQIWSNLEPLKVAIFAKFGANAIPYWNFSIKISLSFCKIPQFILWQSVFFPENAFFHIVYFLTA